MFSFKSSSVQLFSVNSYHSYSKILLKSRQSPMFVHHSVSFKLKHLTCVCCKVVWSALLAANQGPNGATVLSLHENCLNILERSVAALTLMRVWMLPATGTFLFPSMPRELIPILTQFLEAIKLKSLLIKSNIRMLLKILSKLICLLIILQNYFILHKFCFVHAAHIFILFVS